jgi:hypothetical protein
MQFPFGQLKITIRLSQAPEKPSHSTPGHANSPMSPTPAANAAVEATTHRGFAAPPRSAKQYSSDGRVTA